MSLEEALTEVEVNIEAGRTTVLEVKATGQANGLTTGSLEINLVDENGDPVAEGPVYLVSEDGEEVYKVEIDTDEGSENKGSGALEDIIPGIYEVTLEQPEEQSQHPQPSSEVAEEVSEFDPKVIYFETNKSVIGYFNNVNAVDVLEELADFLKKDEQKNVSKIICHGYADKRRGKYKSSVSNDNLSILRGNAAKVRLQQILKDDIELKEKIKSDGKGEIKYGKYEDNRRVEFEIIRIFRDDMSLAIHNFYQLTNKGIKKEELLEIVGFATETFLPDQKENLIELLKALPVVGANKRYHGVEKLKAIHAYAIIFQAAYANSFNALRGLDSERIENMKGIVLDAIKDGCIYFKARDIGGAYAKYDHNVNEYQFDKNDDNKLKPILERRVVYHEAEHIIQDSKLEKNNQFYFEGKGHEAAAKYLLAAYEIVRIAGTQLSFDYDRFLKLDMNTLDFPDKWYVSKVSLEVIDSNPLGTISTSLPFDPSNEEELQTFKENIESFQHGKSFNEQYLNQYAISKGIGLDDVQKLKELENFLLELYEKKGLLDPIQTP